MICSSPSSRVAADFSQRYRFTWCIVQELMGGTLGATVFGNSVSVDAVGNRVGVGVACEFSGGSTL